MSALDLETVRHALGLARQHGFAEIELSVGESSFTATLAPGPTAAGSAPAGSVSRQRLMADEVTDVAGRAGRTLLEAVRENPVPAALMGAGLAWLLFEDKAERAYRRQHILSNQRGYTGNRFTDPGTHSGSYVDARTGRPYDASYGAGYADLDRDGNPDVCPPSMIDKAKSAASGVKRRSAARLTRSAARLIRSATSPAGRSKG